MAKKKKAKSVAKKPVKKATPKKATPKKAVAKKATAALATKATLGRLTLPKPVPANVVLYVDSSFFFPADSSDGYKDDFQSGRYTAVLNRTLQAALPLPVGTTIKSITIYYKNTSSDGMQIAILKKHIDHHCFSGEVEVSLDICPPGTLAPDDYLEKLIDHFDAGGVIADKYLYFIQVFNTGKIDDRQWRTLRGIRIEYAV
jgi:hypothetical protein